MSDTLRTRIPILISQLLERGVKVTLDPNSGKEGFLQLDTSYIKNCNEYPGYAARIAFEPGVHGANSIALERHLVLALEERVIADMNALPKGIK